MTDRPLDPGPASDGPHGHPEHPEHPEHPPHPTHPTHLSTPHR